MIKNGKPYGTLYASSTICCKTDNDAGFETVTLHDLLYNMAERTGCVMYAENVSAFLALDSSPSDLELCSPRALLTWQGLCTVNYQNEL